METLGVNPSSISKRYGYVYDGLNRLTDGYYQNSNNPNSKENTESLAYNLNGNITNLYRTSVLESGTNTAMVINDLGYVYGTGGNQVISINDSAQNPTGYEGGGGTIDYDLNGSMTSMPDKGISTIKYNFMNLPNNMGINKNGNEDIIINTKYRADGAKLRKENVTNVTGINGYTTTVNITDYLDGFQYLHSGTLTPPGGGFEMMSKRAMQPQAFSIDERKVPPPTKTPELQFFPTAEGFYDYQKSQYIYQYKDQLGNARISFARNSAGALEITDANDYYPFGMNHLKTGNAYFGQGSYKSYKYNGKELQESGMYDYGARMYMPDIGRWGVVDPLAELAPGWTSYRYAYNNPLRYIDPKGLFESRKEARQYRREHDLNGAIKRQKDGSYAINDTDNLISYTKGDDSNLASSDTHDNDGVVESVLVKKASYGPKDAFDLTTTDVSLFENTAWKGMSTAQKSKFVWDAKKIIKTTTGIKIPGSTSSWYRTKLPKTMKGIGVAGGVVAGAVIVYDVVDNKQIKASNVLDAAVTGVSFVPGWGWVVGGVFFGADIVTKGVTGQSIGDHLDNYVEENFDKDDGALIDWSKK